MLSTVASLSVVRPSMAARSARTAAKPARSVRARASETENKDMLRYAWPGPCSDLAASLPCPTKVLLTPAPAYSSLLRHCSMSDAMNDVMSKAAGGSTIPGWVPAVPELQSALKILASENTSLGNMVRQLAGRDCNAYARILARLQAVVAFFSDLPLKRCRPPGPDRRFSARSTARPSTATLGELSGPQHWVGHTFVGSTSANRHPEAPRPMYVDESQKRPRACASNSELSRRDHPRFTELAELINGRCAMIGFVACLGATFKGDFLVQFAKAPLGAIARPVRGNALHRLLTCLNHHTEILRVSSNMSSCPPQAPSSSLP